MGQHVLLIEDEPNIAEAIRFILTRDGWRVTIVPDGRGARSQVLHDGAPDLVILDLMLPGLSGLGDPGRAAGRSGDRRACRC